MNIRPLTPADDRMALSRIYEKSWKFAYRDIIPEQYLSSIPEGSWALHTDDPSRQTLLCIEKEQMVGTACFGPARLEQFAGWGEVISIYLLPEAMGKGYGKALMEAAVSALQKQGFTNIYLWVLEENIRARRFYERFGFAFTEDTLTASIGGKELKEVRYIYPTR